MKKNLSILLVLIMVMSLIFTGCGGNDTPEVKDEGEEVVTIKFLHRWPQEPYNTFFEEVVSDFEADNPNIKVDMQSISNDPFKEKIKVVLGTDDAPDVFFTWPGEFTNRFIRAGKVYDLTEEMNSNGWKESYVYSQLEPFVLDEKIYGAPFRVDGKIFVYNKELFEQAGAQVPSTWDEFLTTCQKLEEANIVPIAFGNQSPWAVSHYIGTINQKIIGENIYKAYDPAVGDFSDPGFVKALEEFEKMVPYFNANANAIKHDEARNNWMAGKAAMMYVEIVEIPEIESVCTDEFRDNYGVFNFPIIEDGKGNQSYLTGYPEGFVVSGTTKHPKEAVAFLKYLTGKEVGKKEALELGYINGAKNVVEKGEIADVVYDNTQIVFEAERMVNWLDSGLHAKVCNVYLAELQKLMDGMTTPEEVMQKVQEKATEVKDEF